MKFYFAEMKESLVDRLCTLLSSISVWRLLQPCPDYPEVSTYISHASLQSTLNTAYVTTSELLIISIKILSKERKGRDYSEDLDIDGKIILEWNLRK
jgi:hypothetical protein